MLTQINLVVRDLGLSHAFYRHLGWSMRPITLPGSDEPRAWSTTSGPAPVALHSRSFVGWWDPSGPQLEPGSITMDLTFDDPGQGDRFILDAARSGGARLVESRPMPWGENYAIITDPDGYRWGIKSPIT